MEQKAASVADIIGTQAEMVSDSAASCEGLPATPTQSSTSNCILLNAILTPVPCAPLWMEFPPLPDLSEHATLSNVEILELEVGSPLHVAASTKR
jgi:hypothetical protein